MTADGNYAAGVVIADKPWEMLPSTEMAPMGVLLFSTTVRWRALG